LKFQIFKFWRQTGDTWVITTLIYTFDISASDVEMASREHTDGSLTVKGSINVIKKKSTSKLKEDILRRKFTA
jgi:hypothetical protein